MIRRHRKTRIGTRRRAGGFTLVEAALTTVIIGTGVLSIVAAQQAYHMKNDWAQRTGTAMLLANEIRELTLGMPLHDPISGKSHYGPEADETSVDAYDDIDDFAGTVDSEGFGSGTTFSPPVNALRRQVPDLEGWSQEVQVVNVMPDNISSTITLPLGTEESGTGMEMSRVTVTVRYQGPNDASPQTMTTLTWVVGKKHY